ncbi:hypothetical protein KP78_10430 [Jeotgalibacillus soli]|uniref:Uncharacterized protein n=1 Tax=Jeotgalibacillus soli TaxID=889306 RepID=A0A0C2RHE0_9BACL|nr:hypothetical protein KP78_10430 [Jeotgalibacillus soli]
MQLKIQGKEADETPVDALLLKLLILHNNWFYFGANTISALCIFQ